MLMVDDNTNRSTGASRWLSKATVVVAAMALMVSGCGEDNGELNGNNWDDNDNTGQVDAGGDTDANLGDDGGDQQNNQNGGDNGDDNGGEDNGDDVDQPPSMPGCFAGAEDLGQLEDGTETVTIDFNRWLDTVSTGCDGVVDDSPDAIFGFTLSDEGMIMFEPDAPVAMGLRLHDCMDVSDELVCADDTYGRILPGREQFFLVVEQLPDSPDEIELQFDFHAFHPCDPDEFQSQCVDDQSIQACTTSATSPDIPRQLVIPCPDGCSGERCDGDSCDNPLAVSASTTLSGITAGLGDDIDSTDEPGCMPDGATGSLDGRDLVVRLEGLAAGDSVTIDLESTHGDAAALQIMSSCGSDVACLDAWRGEGQFSFEPDADGDYYLVMDSEFPHEAGFELGIDMP